MTKPTKIPFRLVLPKSVPWWIRWRPSVRRWLREAERRIDEEIRYEDLHKCMRDLIETGRGEYIVKRKKP